MWKQPRVARVARMQSPQRRRRLDNCQPQEIYVEELMNAAQVCLDTHQEHFNKTAPRYEAEAIIINKQEIEHAKIRTVEGVKFMADMSMRQQQMIIAQKVK